jgi:hypothetical protein
MTSKLIHLRKLKKVKTNNCIQLINGLVNKSIKGVGDMISNLTDFKDVKYNSAFIDAGASGFFVEFAMQYGTKLICLVTNHHVIENKKILKFPLHDEHGEIHLTQIRLKDIGSPLMSKGKNISLRGNDSWYGTLSNKHDKYEDIVLIPFLVKSKDQWEYFAQIPMFEKRPLSPNELFLKTLNINDQMIDLDYYKQLDFSDDVYICGYTNGRHGTDFTPGMLKGTFIYLPGDDLNGENHFALNIDGRPGNSGSPVFVRKKEKVILIGVVRAGIEEDNYTECVKVNFLKAFADMFKEDPVKEVW